jgi:hypothetical protein
MAMCVIASVGVAPCQCFSLGANQTTSPARISWTGPPIVLRPAKPGLDNQHLTEGMRMPGGASIRLEDNTCATHTRGLWRLEQRINAHCAGKPVLRSFT